MTQRQEEHPAARTSPGGARREQPGARLERVLDLLACPACLEGWRAEPRPGSEAPEALVCLGCGRAYPVEDGIPILLVDRAVVG